MVIGIDAIESILFIFLLVVFIMLFFCAVKWNHLKTRYFNNFTTKYLLFKNYLSTTTIPMMLPKINQTNR